MTGDDDLSASPSPLADDGRLEDADGADIGDELVVGVIAGRGLAGIGRIGLEDLRGRACVIPWC